MKLVPSGAAVAAPMRDAVPVWYNGQLTLAFFQAFADGYQGYVPGNAAYAGEGHIKSINPPKLIRTGYHPNTNLAALNGASSSDDPEVVLAQSTGQPQNSFPTFSKDNLKMVNDSIKLAQEMTDPKNNKECDEALKAYGIPSLAALINGLTPNGNVFHGRTSTLAGPIGKNGMTESIAAYFKENKTSVGATVFPNSVTGRGSVTFLGDYFFNPPSIAWAAQQRAVIMLHEAVHQVGGKGDAAFGSSKQLSEKIIEKCYPVLKGKLGGVDDTRFLNPTLDHRSSGNYLCRVRVLSRAREKQPRDSTGTVDASATSSRACRKRPTEGHPTARGIQAHGHNRL